MTAAIKNIRSPDIRRFQYISQASRQSFSLEIFNLHENLLFFAGGHRCLRGIFIHLGEVKRVTSFLNLKSEQYERIFMKKKVQRGETTLRRDKHFKKLVVDKFQNPFEIYNFLKNIVCFLGFDWKFKI